MDDKWLSNFLIGITKVWDSRSNLSSKAFHEIRQILQSGKELLSGKMIDWRCNKHTIVFINYVKSLQIKRAIKLFHSQMESTQHTISTARWHND